MKTKIFILLFFTSFSTKTKIVDNNRIITNTSNRISVRDSVKNYIKQLRIRHSDIVFAQAILESGNFNSKIFKENNNLFGMKHPNVRSTISLGSKNGHAYYNNWRESVIDYALWQSSYARKMNEKEFYKYLKNVYAQDSLYIQKIKKIVDGIRK